MLRPRLWMLIIVSAFTSGCSSGGHGRDPCARIDVAALCAELRNADTVEAFVFPDPDMSSPGPEAIEVFMTQVRLAVGPERVLDESATTGRVLVLLDMATLRQASRVPAARFAPNRINAALASPEKAPEKTD